MTQLEEYVTKLVHEALAAELEQDEPEYESEYEPEFEEPSDTEVSGGAMMGGCSGMGPAILGGMTSWQKYVESECAPAYEMIPEYLRPRWQDYMKECAKRYKSKSMKGSGRKKTDYGWQKYMEGECGPSYRSIPKDERPKWQSYVKSECAPKYRKGGAYEPKKPPTEWQKYVSECAKSYDQHKEEYNKNGITWQDFMKTCGDRWSVSKKKVVSGRGGLLY